MTGKTGKTAEELSKENGSWDGPYTPGKPGRPKKERGPKRPPGRPKGRAFVFTEDDVKKIEVLSGYGLNQDQIADVFGISRASFQRYMMETPSVSDAMEVGRTKAVAAVSQSAFQQATSGKSPAMTQYWLNCRARWTQTQVIEHQGVIDIHARADAMTVEAREERIRELATKLGYGLLTPAVDAHDVLIVPENELTN